MKYLKKITEFFYRKNAVGKNDLPEEKVNELIEGLGGKENICLVRNCFMILQFALKDTNKINVVKLCLSGASEARVLSDTQVDIIFNSEVSLIERKLREVISSGAERYYLIGN